MKPDKIVRILALCLCVALLLSFSGCKKPQQEPEATPTPEPTATVTPAPPATKPTPEPTPEPTEPPVISIPVSGTSDPASGSDIVIQFVAPASSSDLYAETAEGSN